MEDTVTKDIVVQDTKGATIKVEVCLDMNTNVCININTLRIMDRAHTPLPKYIVDMIADMDIDKKLVVGTTIENQWVYLGHTDADNGQGYKLYDQIHNCIIYT